jgi:hypothetical protein
VLLFDSTLAHKLLLVQQQLTNHIIMVLSHSLYTLNIALCNFHLIPYMKNQLKGCHFKHAAEVQVASNTALQEDAETSFQKYFKQLYECWQKYVAAQ